MAQSGASNRVAMYGQLGEVKWHPVERLIGQRIMIVDLNLKRGPLIKRVIMAEFRTNGTHLNRPIVIQRRAFDTFL